MLNTLFHLGVSKSLPDYVQRRVIVSNQILIGIILLLLLVFPILFWGQPAIMTVIIASIFICVSLLFLNFLGLVYLSRLLLATLSLTASNVGHAIAIPPQELPIAATFVQATALITLSFTVFDFRENRWVWASFVINVLQMLSFFIWKDSIYLAEGVNYDFLSRDETQLFSTLIGLLILAGSLNLLLQNSRRVAAKNEEQFQRLREKSKAFEESERKLKLMLLDMEGVREEEQKRSWIANGLAQFGDMIREHQGLGYHELHHKIAAKFTRYLDAVQGGLYLIIRDKSSQEAKEIRLVGCYAYQQQRYQEQSLPIDEGLMAQVFKDAKSRQLRQVPENYFLIESALGAAPPNSVLIVPAKYNEQVEAIIEVAAFKPFPDYKIEFLEKLGEIIAATSVQNRLKSQTESLLRKTQQKGKDLYQQEDNMRQAMERLSAKEYEQEVKLQDYEDEIKALKQKIAALETQINKDQTPL